MVKERTSNTVLINYSYVANNSDFIIDNILLELKLLYARLKEAIEKQNGN